MTTRRAHAPYRQAHLPKPPTGVYCAHCGMLVIAERSGGEILALLAHFEPWRG